MSGAQRASFRFTKVTTTACDAPFVFEMKRAMDLSRSSVYSLKSSLYRNGYPCFPSTSSSPLNAGACFSQKERMGRFQNGFFSV